jgi:hypothetical protein
MTMSISADGHVVLARLRDAGEDEDADAGAGEQRGAEPVEAGDHGRGQAVQQGVEAERRVARDADERRLREDRQAGQQAGQRPATVPTRLTGMPSSAARSAFSAAARTAMPMRLRLKNSASPPVSRPTTRNANTWLPDSTGSPRELSKASPAHGVSTTGGWSRARRTTPAGRSR